MRALRDTRKYLTRLRVPTITSDYERTAKQVAVYPLQEGTSDSISHQLGRKNTLADLVEDLKSKYSQPTRFKFVNADTIYFLGTLEDW